MNIDPSGVNWLAVAAAGGASFFLGFVWYTLLFSQPWMKAMGLKSDDVDSSGISGSRALIASAVASLATAAGVALLLSAPGNVLSLWGALGIAALVWVAFSLTPMVKMVFWEDRPLTLLAIDGGYELVSIVTAATIVIIWPS